MGGEEEEEVEEEEEREERRSNFSVPPPRVSLRARLVSSPLAGIPEEPGVEFPFPSPTSSLSSTRETREFPVCDLHATLTAKRAGRGERWLDVSITLSAISEQ